MSEPPAFAPELAGPGATLFALLVCGHLLADFVLQTSWMVRHKARERKALAAHVLTVLGVQAACVLPVFHHPIALVFAGLIAALHGLIDLVKGRARPRFGLLPFLADQLLHLLVLVLVLRLWLYRFEGPPPTPFGPGELGWIFRATVFVGVAAFNVNGASALVTSALSSIGADASEPAGERPARVGRLVGILERLLVLAAVALGEWGAVGLVLAAKSIARFQQLDDRDFAEKYLVGTLTSVLIAVASGWLVGVLVV